MKARPEKAKVAAAVRKFYAKQKPVGMIVGVLPSAKDYDGRYWSFPQGRIGEGPGSAPPDNRTVWQIGSVTKTFTATLLAAGVRHLSLGLDDLAQDLAPAAVNLPSFDTWQNSAPILLWHLATHTAGLPFDPRGMGTEGYSRNAMYDYLSEDVLPVEPGTSWNYSNLGFGLLANLLMEVGEAQSYEELLDWLKLLGGLPLPDTSTEPTLEQRSRRSLGYASPGLRARWRTATWPAFDGSGALYSTLDDQMIWLAYNLGWLNSPIDDLLPITQKIYFSGDQAVMGLAWQFSPIPGTSRKYIGKSGNTNGFTSMVAFDCERTCGVVALCNTASVWPQPLVEEILGLMVG